MIQRVNELLPDPITKELQMLNAIGQPWVEIIANEHGFEARYPFGLPPILRRMATTLGCEDQRIVDQSFVGMYAWSLWLKDGPKIIRASNEQAESLRHVSIDLELSDYSQPFPTVLVELPGKAFDPFKAVLCSQYSQDILVLNLISERNENDICTCVRNCPGIVMERSLEKVSDELETLLDRSLPAQRVALNMCLMLSNFGFNWGPAFPKVMATDQMYAKEQSERGERARERLKTALYQVDFQQHTIVRRSAPSGESSSTGKTVPAHWVRGHWRMQVHGPANSLRKRILIRPYLTHAETVASPIGAIYHERRT